MLNMSQVIAVSAQEDDKGFLGVATVAAIFIARCKIGSEKMADVRGEIKSALELMPDGETKVPKSTLNRYILNGLLLARRLCYAAPEGAVNLQQDKAFLATVAAEADARNLATVNAKTDQEKADAETISDHVTTLATFLKRQRVTIKVNGTAHPVPVTNANRITKLLNKPATPPTIFAQIRSALKKADQLQTDEIETLQKELAIAMRKAALRDVQAIAA
jgi:hypothetical protein